MTTSGTTTEKATVVEVARVRWLLAAGLGITAAAFGVYRAFPGGKGLEPVRAVLAALVAAGGLFTCLLWLLSKRQLLIGETRVLLLSVRTKRIVGHIPYDQIEGVHFHHGEDDDLVYNPGVTITVRADRGPETFWPWLLPGETEVVIPNRFVRTPAVLRKMLRSRWQEHRRKREAAARPAGGWSAGEDVVG